MCSAAEGHVNPDLGPIIQPVPLYDFRCRSCQERFEARSAVDELPDCPKCGATDTERLLSPFAGPFTIGLRGAAARRSNAIRRAREEQRREQKALRQERRREDPSSATARRPSDSRRDA